MSASAINDAQPKKDAAALKKKIEEKAEEISKLKEKINSLNENSFPKSELESIKAKIVKLQLANENLAKILEGIDLVQKTSKK